MDEGTDIAVRKELVHCAKIVNEGVPEMVYLKTTQVPDGTSSSIVKATTDYLEKNAIAVTQINSLTTDGAAVMTGKKNGVATKLKELNPAIVDIHCMNHRLALAAKDSFESITEFRAVDETLTAVFKYYHYSAVRSSALQEIQKITTDQTITMKSAAHTRWLSHEAAVKAVTKSYEPLLLDLENAVSAKRENIRFNSGPTASGLLKNLKNFKTLSILMFLADCLPHLSRLALVFESRTVDLSVVHPKVQSTVMTLDRLKEAKGVNYIKIDDICERLNIAKSVDLQQPINTFIDNLKTNITNRLSNSECISAFGVLDLRLLQDDNVTFYGDEEIQILSAKLGTDEDATMSEWLDFKSLFLQDKEKCTIQHLLLTLSEWRPSLAAMYPNLLKLISVASTLCISSSECERVFSKIKLCVTSQRSQISMPNLHRILMIQINGADRDNFPFDRAVDKWVKMKKKRRLFC